MTKDAHRRPKGQLIEDDSERLGYKSGRLEGRELGWRRRRGDSYEVRLTERRREECHAIGPLQQCSKANNSSANNSIPSIQVSHLPQILLRASADHVYRGPGTLAFLGILLSVSFHSTNLIPWK